MAHYYIKTIQYTPTKPSSCMTCGRDNLADGIVEIKTGSDTASLTLKENAFCLFCETLMVITNEEKKAMQLKAANSEDKVTIVHDGGR